MSRRATFSVVIVSAFALATGGDAALRFREADRVHGPGRNAGPLARIDDEFEPFAAPRHTAPVSNCGEPLRHEGKMLDEWVSVAKNHRVSVTNRRHAIRVLGRFGKEAIPHLIALLRDPSSLRDPIAGGAACSLARIGGDDSRAALVQQLRTVPLENADQRHYVFASLALMRDPGKAAPDVLAFLNPPLAYRPFVESVVTELDPTVMVPMLLQTFGSKNPSTTTEVSNAVQSGRALIWFGPAGKPAIEPARRLLSHRDAELAMVAARVLGAVGAEAADAVPDLIRAIEQPVKLGKDRRDPRAGVRFAASEALVAIGKPAVPALLARAKERAELPSYLIDALGRIGSPHANDAVPILTALVKNQSGNADVAIAALGGFPDKGEEVAQTLLHVLNNDKRRSSHAVALPAIAKLGPKAKPAANTIAELVSDQTHPLRDSVYEAALALGSEGKPVLPFLSRLLTAEDDVNRSITQRVVDRKLDAALPRFGALIVPELIKVLEAREKSPTGTDPLQNRRIELALHALREIGEPAKAAGPTLRALARATDQQLLLVREPSLAAIGKIRPDPKEDIPLLKEMLGALPPYKDAPPALNRGAAQAIWDYGPAAKELAPVLLKKLSSKADARDFETRWRCLRALPAIGVSAEDAVPVLMQYLASRQWSDDYYSFSAATALAAYGPRAKAAVAPARECLDSPSQEVRAQACRLLAAIGPDAKAALPDLREFTYDESAEVRDAARAAIKILGK